MPECRNIVVNTGPLIALIAAMGDLSFLSSMYERILVPFEVCREIASGGKTGFAISEFNAATFLGKQQDPLDISPFLANSLDLGEAAVIQLALDEGIRTVCIDEVVGRRVARLNGLDLTGSIGVLIRARKMGNPFSMRKAIERMRENGVWLSEKVVRIALSHDDR